MNSPAPASPPNAAPGPPIARLVANLARPDPRLAAALRGASAAEIDALAAVAGQPLPPVYREFLERMGHGMGWLHPAPADFGISALAQHLNEQPWRAPAGLLLIGLADADPCMDIYLEDGGPKGLRVAAWPRGPWADIERTRFIGRQPLAGSLPQYLGSWAYRQLRLALFPHRLRASTLAPGGREIDRLAAPAKALKLQPSWFSNDWVQVHDGKDGGLVASQFDDGALAIDIGADTAGRCEAIAHGLRDALGVPMRLS